MEFYDDEDEMDGIEMDNYGDELDDDMYYDDEDDYYDEEVDDF